MPTTTTRDRLVRGGLDLLVEGGWARVSSRAVAERAGANLGLIHYHFGGMAGLRLAITSAAVDLLVGELDRDLLAATDLDEMLEVLAAGLDATSGSAVAAQLTAALIEGAAREPALAGALRDTLRDARTDLATRLAATHPSWSPARVRGVATLVVAATDGLSLHRLVDDELATTDALVALRDLIGGPVHPPAEAR